jgi:hypothetical protein
MSLLNQKVTDLSIVEPQIIFLQSELVRPNSFTQRLDPVCETPSHSLIASTVAIISPRSLHVAYVE